MKKLSTLLLASTLTFSIQAQNIGVNSTGAAPNNSAIMDLNTGNTFTSPNGKGLLTPNVALTSITDAVTVTSPATSLLVFNTSTAGVIPNNVVPGYYYWDGTKWVRLQTTAGTSADWSTTGNLGTNVAINFLGTTDAQDLVLKTNNTEKIRVATNGNVGIGTAVGTPTTPNTSLDVVGTVAFREATLVLANGNNNNIVIGNNTFLTISAPTASFVITGISNGYSGQIVTLYNRTGLPMQIANQNVGSSVNNRILTLTGSDIITTQESSVIQLQYSVIANAWIVISGQNTTSSSTSQNGQIQISKNTNQIMTSPYVTNYQTQTNSMTTNGIFTANLVAGTITVLKSGFYFLEASCSMLVNPSTAAASVAIVDLTGNSYGGGFKEFGELPAWPNIVDDFYGSASTIAYLVSGSIVRVLSGPNADINILNGYLRVTSVR